jgi:hypothetical protein
VIDIENLSDCPRRICGIDRRKKRVFYCVEAGCTRKMQRRKPEADYPAAA